MTKNDVLTMLRVGNVPIEFVKVDGTMRTMTATLNENQIYIHPLIQRTLIVNQMMAIAQFGMCKTMLGNHFVGQTFAL